MHFLKKQTITLTLLLVASSQLHAESNMEKRERPHSRPSFESLDLNGNKEIDLEEFSAHKIPHGDHETVFNYIDTDGSGVITNEEFVAHKPPKHRHNRDNS